jgi:hypothetical protein
MESRMRLDGKRLQARHQSRRRGPSEKLSDRLPDRQQAGHRQIAHGIGSRPGVRERILRHQRGIEDEAAGAAQEVLIVGQLGAEGEPMRPVIQGQVCREAERDRIL